MLCSKCRKRESIYHRAYSGEYLCKKCFIKTIENKTARTISKFSMIKNNDRIAVGVSGGKDSLSLLYILKRIIDDHANRNNELVAVTIDEGINGYRDESLQIVKDFCSELKVESKVLSYKTIFGISMDEAMMHRPSEKMTSCSMCGTFRRRAIDIAAETLDADVIATAHNMDDQLQTFMINLVAGDIERIGWMHPQPVEYGNGMRKIKPFVEIYEYEIAFYALQCNIPFQSEECPYMNESIRSEMREFFNKLEKIHPGIKYNTYSSMMKISETMRGGLRSEYKKCSNCARDSSCDLCSVCKTITMLMPSSPTNKYSSSVK
jgi:uncharacterized protein (TIGR00269 family)